MAQNSSVGYLTNNHSSPADADESGVSHVGWADWQIRLAMLLVMGLFFAACAAAWWASFQRPAGFFLSVKDTMTYNSLGLLSWMALADATRTVWSNYTLWIMACRFSSVVLAIAVLEMSMFADPGSMDPLAFSEITSVLTVFVSLLLLDWVPRFGSCWQDCLKESDLFTSSFVSLTHS